MAISRQFVEKVMNEHIVDTDKYRYEYLWDEERITRVRLDVLDTTEALNKENWATVWTKHRLTKSDLKRIENVSHYRFELDGEVWELAGTSKNRGVDAGGIWSDMTNGKITVRLYKKDLDLDKATALFN